MFSLASALLVSQGLGTICPLIIDSEQDLAEIVRSVRTVAVVGMKDGADPTAPAYTVARVLQARGIRILPVNPKLSTVLGERAYPNLASLPERPDVVDVFRRPEAVGPLGDEILALPPEKRPRVIWLQTGIRNDAAAEKLSAAGIQVVMDRCLGVYVARFRPAR